MITKKQESYSTFEFTLPQEDIDLFIADIDPQKEWHDPNTGHLTYPIEGYMTLTCLGASRTIKMKRVVIII